MNLLLLERMRMIDAAHEWAPRTLENECRTLRRTNIFLMSMAFLHFMTNYSYHHSHILPLTYPSLYSGVWNITPPAHLHTANGLRHPGIPLVPNVIPFLCIVPGLPHFVILTTPTKMVMINYSLPLL